MTLVTHVGETHGLGLSVHRRLVRSDLGHLAEVQPPTRTAVAEVAPWWPLRVDAPTLDVNTSIPVPVFPDIPHAVLGRLESLDATFGAEPITETLQRLYQLLPQSEPTDSRE